MLTRSFLVLCFLLGLAVAQTCSPTSACAEGCCNKFGNCGFGPDFCGTTCISDCGRKSECNPGYGAAWSMKDKCPLNVCCSKHGYCGTTDQFCGDKQVARKTCSKTNGIPRVIGYFEGWAQDRPCNVFWPEQIPLGLYTHINFAFATIDPGTFKVVPASPNDLGLYKRLTVLKRRDPNLKVFIAIGGWTFNDPGPTATTFSDIAASIPRQKAFIESLISFMSTHGFDGVDLDWEYPGAEDRSGRGVDFANFPKFMERLKSSLASTKKEISITLPASYWYLQHFDIKALIKHVHWFNIMSYDMHGTWDKGNKWTGNFLNAHTNLTEISDALDLLWRNDINPGQVVMGLGFYGRTFSATTSSCMTPGCTFESGGERGRCSRETGVLLNSEIDDAVKKNGVTPRLYSKEAVKVASWGNNQWVAYDDEETFKMRSEYAQGLCLGGLMVWAISHDTQDAKYSRALARVVNRRVSALPLIDEYNDETIDIHNDQCKWTNCKEDCPPGYVIMERKDKGARGKEYMFDQTGCSGDDYHRFCCPASQKLPTCGWYTHNNGACNNQCPSGTVEVGSNRMYCNKGYQAACCTTETKSMKLYTTCEWGQYPNCDSQKGCPSTGGKTVLLASSTTGTGGGRCSASIVGESLPGTGIDSYQHRKMCCDTSDAKARLSSCQWYAQLGFGPKSAGKNHCLSGCPGDTVRMAMDSATDACKGGARARCCSARYVETITVENPELAAFEEVMDAYVKNPTCPRPGLISNPVRRDVNLDAGPARTLGKRDSSDTFIVYEMLIKILNNELQQSLRRRILAIWNDRMGRKYGKGIEFPALQTKLDKMPVHTSDGAFVTAEKILCRPEYYASAGDEGAVDCTEPLCSDHECESNPERRDAAAAEMSESLGNHHHQHQHRHGHAQVPSAHAENVILARESRSSSALDKRIAPRRDYSTTVTDSTGRQTTFTITLPEYFVVSDYPAGSRDPVFDEAVDVTHRGDCAITQVDSFTIPTGETFEMEHIVDGQLIRRFMQDAARGNLRSGTVAATGPVAVSFFQQARTMPLPLPPAVPGTAALPADRLYTRVMECLGSTDNSARFVLAHKDINSIKGHLAQGHYPVSLSNIPIKARSLLGAVDLLKHLRAAVAMIRYLNHGGPAPNVNRRLEEIVNCVDGQWEYAQQQWNAANPGQPTTVRDFWREWARDYYGSWLVAHTRTFVREGIRALRAEYTSTTEQFDREVRSAVLSLEGQLAGLAIRTAGFN